MKLRGGATYIYNMENYLKKRKDEQLWQWINRLSSALGMTAKQTEALREVSKQSYFEGVDDANELHYLYSKDK